MLDHDAPSTDAPPPRRRDLRRLGVLAVVASFVGIWGYVMYLSFVEGRTEPRDRLDDRAWTETAEATCAESTPVFEALPFANEVSTPAQRADLVSAGTDELETMVERLSELPPPDAADEARAVERWLDDYRTYLRDRREHEAAQRDPTSDRYDEPFSMTDRGGYQVEVLIDDFAHVNYMESCETPGDL